MVRVQLHLEDLGNMCFLLVGHRLGAEASLGSCLPPSGDYELLKQLVFMSKGNSA